MNIEAQEAAGQKAFVSSETLPKNSPREQLEQVGVKLGEDVDDLFVNVTLPEWEDPMAYWQMRLEDVAAAWNAQADEYNQWDALDSDERVAFALRHDRLRTSMEALDWYDNAMAEGTLTRDSFHLFILGIISEYCTSILPEPHNTPLGGTSA